MVGRLLSPAAKLRFVAISSICLVAMLAPLGRVQAADVPSAVYTMSIDGQNVRKLAQVDGYNDHAAPRWSHDGNFVAFDAMPAGGGIRKCFVIAADGSVLQVIDGNAMPAWSPDDKRLAFQVSARDGRDSIVVQNLNGQGRAEIGPGMSPSWSPDGGKLAVSDGRMLRIIDLAGGEDVPLFDEPFFELSSGFDWSPDGKMIGFVSNREVP
jgi:Tol biopolymer transport system component